MKPDRGKRYRKASGSTTIIDVAAEAGVSTATVSRVLAGLNGVRDETRHRILRAIAKLDFHPNRLARGLRVGHWKLIGVVIPDLQNPFFTGIVHGIEAVLYGAGYTMLLGHSDGLADREEAQLRVLRGGVVAGLILVPGNAQGANYEAFRDCGIPVVAADRSPKGIELDLVRSNNREGMRLAVDHLLSLGYKEIALLNGPEGMDVTMERLLGYRDALSSAGVLLRQDLVIHSDFRQEGGRTAMKSILDMAKPPRAVVIANNLMTLGALQAIHERGIRIPEDLAVVCFDDMPWVTSINPPLTAVAQFPEEIGRTAAQLLLERLKDPNRLVRKVLVPTRLMVRSSCGAPLMVNAA